MANGYVPHPTAAVSDVVAGLAGITSYNIADWAPMLGALSAAMSIVYFTFRFVHFMYHLWKEHNKE